MTRENKIDICVHAAAFRAPATWDHVVRQVAEGVAYPQGLEQLAIHVHNVWREQST